MLNGQTVIGVIPARAGSKRLPGKNLRPMAGRPMIGWTFEAALGAAVLDRLVVTSDDEAVLAYAEACGVEAVRRPAELAGDRAPVVDAVLHLLATVGGRWDHVVLLQPTSPLRRSADIDEATHASARQGAPVVTACVALQPPQHHGLMGRDGALSALPDAQVRTVRLNGAVYATSVASLRETGSFCPAGARIHLMPPERSWDVDSLEEFAACEALLSRAAASQD